MIHVVDFKKTAFSTPFGGVFTLIWPKNQR